MISFNKANIKDNKCKDYEKQKILSSNQNVFTIISIGYKAEGKEGMFITKNAIHNKEYQRVYEERYNSQFLNQNKPLSHNSLKNRVNFVSQKCPQIFWLFLL